LSTTGRSRRSTLTTLSSVWDPSRSDGKGKFVIYLLSYFMVDGLVQRCTILPPSRNIRTWRVQTQGITVRGNDFNTPHFTLPTNSPPTHQPNSILSYPSRILYFGTKFEPFRTLYFGTEGVVSISELIHATDVLKTIYMHVSKS
jgi:hypothetical protein